MCVAKLWTPGVQCEHMYSINHTCFFLSEQVLWLTPGTLHFYIHWHGWEHLCGNRLPRRQAASQWRLEVTLKVQPGNLLKSQDDKGLIVEQNRNRYRCSTWLEWGLNDFTSTAELSGVWHTDSGASLLCTAGGEGIKARLGVTQGDKVKLRPEGSGARDTGGSALQGEGRRSTSTASAGVPSSTTEMDGSACKCGIVLTSTFSDWQPGLPSGWLTSESTSLTGEKQRETSAVSFLLWDSWGVPHWDLGACPGVWLREREREAGARTSWAGEAGAAWTGVWANARDRRVTLLGER